MKFSRVLLISLMVRASAFVPRTAAAKPRSLNLFNKLFSSSTDSKYPVMADESVMSQKKHGTSDAPVQKDLRWNCDFDTADRICNFK